MLMGAELPTRAASRRNVAIYNSRHGLAGWVTDRLAVVATGELRASAPAARGS